MSSSDLPTLLDDSRVILSSSLFTCSRVLQTLGKFNNPLPRAHVSALLYSTLYGICVESMKSGDSNNTLSFGSW